MRARRCGLGAVAPMDSNTPRIECKAASKTRAQHQQPHTLVALPRRLLRANFDDIIMATTSTCPHKARSLQPLPQASARAVLRAVLGVKRRRKVQYRRGLGETRV